MTAQRAKVLLAGLLLFFVGLSGIGLNAVAEENTRRCADGRCESDESFAWAGLIGVGLAVPGALFLGTGILRRWG